MIRLVKVAVGQPLFFYIDPDRKKNTMKKRVLVRFLFFRNDQKLSINPENAITNIANAFFYFKFKVYLIYEIND